MYCSCYFSLFLQTHTMFLSWFSDKASYLQKWPLLSDSVNSFSMWTGALIGTENDFMHQRLRFAGQVLHYRHDYWNSFKESHPHHAQSHLLPWKCQRNGRVLHNVGHIPHARAEAKPNGNWQSTYLYIYTHVLVSRSKGVFTPWGFSIYLLNVCLCHQCPCKWSAALHRWQQPLLISRPWRWPDTRGCLFHSCLSS